MLFLVIKYWLVALAAALTTQYIDAQTTARNVNAPCHCMTEVNPYYRPANNTAVAFGKHVLVDGVVLFSTRRWSDTNKALVFSAIAVNSAVQTNVNNHAWNSYNARCAGHPSYIAADGTVVLCP
jgi:hypothetical protein